MSLPDCREDPSLDLLGDLVSHNGLKLWLLQAEIWEDWTLVCWVKLPQDGVLCTQIEEVHFPDGEEGLWCCVSHRIFYLVAMASQIVRISHEDNGRLPLGAD